MKWTALGLLVAAGALYLLASVLRAQSPAWGYLAAFSEAAMVGAIADWFAVVALFRRPLGLPIPHTAIIPSNKDRIGANLADFICAHFLSTAQVLSKLERFGAAGRLADWLADAGHAQQTAAHLGDALRYLLRDITDDPMRRFLRSAVLGPLQQLDAASWASRLVDALPAERRQALLDALLHQLASVLDNDALKVRLAELIADELKVLRVVGLDNVAGRYATGKLVSGLGRLVEELAEDPAHPLRLRFDAFAADFVARLRDDPALRARVAELQRSLLDSTPMLDGLLGLWQQLAQSLDDDLARPDSRVRDKTVAAVQRLGARLQQDAALQQWLNAQLVSAAPDWIERYREEIRRYIVARVGDWNAAEMTRELERSIGRDLQFIRINGTLVGGLAGLAIYSATRLLQAG